MASPEPRDQERAAETVPELAGGEYHLGDEEIQRLEPKTIHILGVGAIGKLIAHSLRGISNPPPVTLVVHRRGLLGEWRRNHNKAITIQADGKKTSATGFGMELALPPLRAFGIEVDDPDYVWKNPDGLLPHEAAARLKEQNKAGTGDTLSDLVETQRVREPEESDEPIHHIIITVKAQLTISALSAIKHRLLPTSTVCFLQNGMGIVDEVNAHVFPDPATRPNYMFGIVSHGVNSPRGSNPWFAIHAGRGTIALSVLPRATSTATTTSSSSSSDGNGPFSPETDITTDVPFSYTSRHLMQTLTRTPALGAIGVPRAEFVQQKLEKLAQNAVINPLTVMLDARNGAVIYNYAVTKVMRLLLAEISLVLRSLPELKGLPNVQRRFSAERLETLVVGIANRTSQNISSMLSDVRNGRQTEVRYINGYVIRRGEELGLACVSNYMLFQLVSGKSKMVQDEARDEVSVGAVEDAPGKG